MKKIVEVEKTLCDFCGKDCYEKCLGCGKDACWECQKMEGIEFKHGVYCSGSGDGFFCWSCLANPPKKIIPKLKAYCMIHFLRQEQEFWGNSFQKRVKEAEEKLASIPFPENEEK